MKSAWKERARGIIRQVLSRLPKDASDRERRAAVSAAYPWGERRHHPYRMWCAAVRQVLGPARKKKPPLAANPDAVAWLEDCPLVSCPDCKGQYRGGCILCRPARERMDALPQARKEEWAALRKAALRGDPVAADALADWLAEHWEGGAA